MHKVQILQPLQGPETQTTQSFIDYGAAGQHSLFLRYGSVFMTVHLAILHSQALLMPKLDASGTLVRIFFV